MRFQPRRQTPRKADPSFLKTMSSRSKQTGVEQFVGVGQAAALWQLGLVTDRRGHVHLGAIIGAGGAAPPTYIDLLAPVGASEAADLDLNRIVPLVRGEHLADLRRIVGHSIDDSTLKARLLALVEGAWTD
jgi:hypothetical protein